MPDTRHIAGSSKQDLWLRLRSYHFDHLAPPHLTDSLRAAFGGADASTRAFADKLARKLRWKRPFAMRAIGEYKKFVYLGMVADFPVTPPRVIDQVWHEHLLFTRGYREFCDHVLGRDFDHNPELVPADEQTAAFQAQYAATLDLYRAEFNTEPHPAFWGTPKFAADAARTESPVRRRVRDAAWISSGDTPLYACFDGSGNTGSSAAMPEFGGGESGGGGGGGEFGDPGPDAGAGTDSTGSAASDGSGASDGGGSDSGGSSCSSGCSSGCGSS